VTLVYGHNWDVLICLYECKGRKKYRFRKHLFVQKITEFHVLHLGLRTSCHPWVRVHDSPVMHPVLYSRCLQNNPRSRYQLSWFRTWCVLFSPTWQKEFNKCLNITDSRPVLSQIIAENHLYTAGKASLNNVIISLTTKVSKREM